MSGPEFCERWREAAARFFFARRAIAAGSRFAPKTFSAELALALLPPAKMAEPITCKAMVAFGVNDLREEEIIVAPPKAGEVSGAIRVCYNTTHHSDSQHNHQPHTS